MRQTIIVPFNLSSNIKCDLSIKKKYPTEKVIFFSGVLSFGLPEILRSIIMSKYCGLTYTYRAFHRDFALAFEWYSTHFGDFRH